MDPNLTQEQAQAIWNEEAALLNAPSQEAGGELDASAADTAALADAESQPGEPAVSGEVNPENASAADEAQAEEGQSENPLHKLEQEAAELRANNAQLLQRAKSAEGRAAAVQRELEQAKKAQQTVADSPTEKQIADAANSPEKWDALKDEFPEWTDAIHEFVESKLKTVSVSSAAVDPATVQQQIAEAEANIRKSVAEQLEFARLEGKYETWRDIVKTTDFAAWFSVQKPEVKALIESPKATDAISLLDQFHKDKQRRAADIKNRRSERLSSATSSRPGQVAPSRSLDDMSAQDLWDYEARQREEARARRGY